MTGWVSFAAIMMVIIERSTLSGLDRDHQGQYYVPTANQIIVFDIKTWGWTR